MEDIDGIEVMCCRYYIWSETYEYFDDLPVVGESVRLSGDIHPSENAFIIRNKADKLCGQICSWGYPSNGNKGLVINARAETLHEKSMFSEDIMKRRCLVPANGFYEWDRLKQKANVTVPDEPFIYFAGIYGIRAGMERFVIITRPSAGEMSRIHERMPLIVPKDKVGVWFSENYRDVLASEPVHVKADVENEQMTFL